MTLIFLLIAAMMIALVWYVARPLIETIERERAANDAERFIEMHGTSEQKQRLALAQRRKAEILLQSLEVEQARAVLRTASVRELLASGAVDVALLDELLASRHGDELERLEREIRAL